MRLSTSSWICCARRARPDHHHGHRRHGELRVLELTELREAEDARRSTITMIRNSTTARCFSAHSVRLKDFIAACRACDCDGFDARAGQRDLQSGRHLLHARGDDLLAGRRPGDQHVVVAIAVHRDSAAGSTVPTGSLPARLTTHTAGWPLSCVSAVAGITAAGRSLTTRSTIERGASRRAAASARVDRLQPGAIGARLRRPPAATARAARRRRTRRARSPATP